MDANDTLAIIFSCVLYVMCCINCYKYCCCSSQNENENGSENERKKQKLLENNANLFHKTTNKFL